MIEPKNFAGDARVYYNVLEADEKGRVPGHSEFDSNSKSGLHMIAKSCNKASI